MPENAKFTDKAAELASKAAAAAGPLVAQAKERAGQAAAAAAPLAEQARVKAAQGVDVLAGNLDKLTGGKYSDKIHSVASKVEGALDTKSAPSGETVAPSATPTSPVDTVVPPTVVATAPETDLPPTVSPTPAEPSFGTTPIDPLEGS